MSIITSVSAMSLSRIGKLEIVLISHHIWGCHCLQLPAGLDLQIPQRREAVHKMVQS